MEEKRKKLLKENYHPQGLIILTILLIIVIYIILSSKILEVRNIKMLFDVLSKHGFELCFSTYFISIFIIIIYSYIFNFLVKPKKEVLYLYDNTPNTSIFINKKGKKFEVPFCSKEKEKYYYVLKTKDYIYEVLEENFEEHEGWSKQIKYSYWFNFYTPFGDIEDVFLIPILYVFVIPDIMSVLFAHGFAKLFGVILAIFPSYFIIYDLVYKIKQKRNNEQPVNCGLKKIFYTFRQIFPLVIILAILIILLITLYNAKSISTKIVIFIFSVIICFLVLSTGAKLFKRKELETIFTKLVYLSILLFWFGALIFATIITIKTEYAPTMILFTIPFWIVGIYIFYKLIIKK